LALDAANHRIFSAGDNGKLVVIDTKTGSSGICSSDATCSLAKIKDLKIPKCPFANLPETSEGRWGQGLTADKMKGCVWVKTEIVVRIDFAEWTGADKLRNYVFELTTSSKELNPKNFFGNLALHSVKSLGITRHSSPVS
jgi:hypothetical protein